MMPRTATPTGSRPRIRDLAMAGAAVLAVVAGASAAYAQKVGVTSAVNPASHAGGKTLAVGAAVIHNERITTDAEGSVQLLFLDRTTMVIGPNSDLVIDDFVYNPAQGTGHMAVTLSRGLMRFVGGQVAHQGGATVRMPTALAGVRGGTAQFSVEGDKNIAVFLGANGNDGALTVAPCNNGGSNCNVNRNGRVNVGGMPGNVRLFRPGFAIDGGLIGRSRPFRFDIATLAQQNRLLTAGPGSPLTGGVSRPISDGVAKLAGSSSGRVATNAISPRNNRPPSNTNTGDSDALTEAQRYALAHSAIAFSLSMGNCCTLTGATSLAPFLQDTFAFAGNVTNSPVYGYRPKDQSNALSVTMQYGFQLASTGDVNNAVTGQSAWFYVATGGFVSDGSGGQIWTGGFIASRRETSDHYSGSAGIDFTSSSVAIDPVTMLPVYGAVNENVYTPAYEHIDEVDILADLQPLVDASPAAFSSTDANILAAALDLLTSTPATYSSAQASDYPGDTDLAANPFGTETNYDFAQPFVTTGLPADLGVNRPQVALAGYVAGIAELSDTLNPVTLEPVTGVMGLVLDPDRALLMAAVKTSLSTTPVLYGSVPDYPGLANKSAYIDYDHFAARRTDADITSPDRKNGALVTITADDAAAIVAQIPGAAGTTICECEYTRWGLWAQEDINTGTTTAKNVPFGFWVAGRPTTSAEIPTTGTATYDGHVMANMYDSTRGQFIAAGNFSNTVNFGTGAGTVSVTGLDGVDYLGVTSIGVDRSTFTGALTDGNSLDMALDGSFFRGTAGPAGEMGGTVAISDGVGDYGGAGIFAAQQQPPP